MSNLLYDVAIIGAGPAGSSAAFALERAGLDFVILDKSRFPRPKPCAGVLPPRIFSEISIPDGIVERPLLGYRLFSPSNEVLETVFPKPGVIVRREVFDNHLHARLSNTPRNEHVTGFKIAIDCAVLKTKKGSLSAKLIIAADGANSTFQKTIAGKGKSQRNSKDLALGAQTEVRLPRNTIDEHVGDFFEVYYTLSYGYGWISPQRESVKVGIGGMSLDIKKNAKKVLGEFLKQERIKEKVGPCSIDNFEAHSIPMKGPYDELNSDRILLCGDAGGFVFPGTGEGIYYAVKSGRIAAESGIAALKNEDLSREVLGKLYQKKLMKNGLMSLRDVNFIDEVLASEEKATRYIRRLKRLAVK